MPPPAEDEAYEFLATEPITVAGQELRLFLESPPLIRSMTADILAARQRVWLECYIMLSDAAGQAVADALAARARAGLDVRLLYDAVGSQGTPAAFFQRLTQAGVQVHAFHTIWEALRQFSFTRVLNRRNHRKVLVVDDEIAYFGGMNVLDQRTDDAPPAPGQRPRASGWRDVHVRLCGPRQADVAESFERSWRRALKQPNRRRSKAYRRGRFGGAEEGIYFFDSGPGRKYSRASLVLTRLIGRAKTSITMSMAYFLPVGRLLWTLVRARRRGVRVQVVLPSRSDVTLVERATRHSYPRLLKRGFEVFERQQRMLHSKALVVDDLWSLVGSCNLDARSLFYNYEFLAVIRSTTFAKKLTEICQYEADHSRPVTAADCAARGRWDRWLDRWAYALRWWL